MVQEIDVMLGSGKREMAGAPHLTSRRRLLRNSAIVSGGLVSSLTLNKAMAGSGIINPGIDDAFSSPPGVVDGAVRLTVEITTGSTLSILSLQTIVRPEGIVGVCGDASSAIITVSNTTYQEHPSVAYSPPAGLQPLTAPKLITEGIHVFDIYIEHPDLLGGKMYDLSIVYEYEHATEGGSSRTACTQALVRIGTNPPKDQTP